MINFPYFKQVIKSNVKLLILFILVLCVFLVVMCSVFTPSTLSGLENTLSGTFATNILTGSSLVGFMSNSFYALMAILFPMVYSIVVGNNLIAKKVDDGSMAGYLSTPVSRKKIVVSSALYFILSLLFMWVVVTVLGIVVANAFQPGELDKDKFFMLNIGAFLYHFAISSICFAASCVFNTSKNSLLIGAGIPLYCYVISLFIKMSDDLDWMKYITLNTLFDTKAIIRGEGYTIQFVVLILIGVVLYITGIEVFKKKNLPL
jgi:ABC-2 type transport system permease protein